jgi:chloride channel protein, CIC family
VTATAPKDAAGAEPALAGAAYLRLVLIAAAVGLPAALVAAGFLGAVHELEAVLWPDSPPAYLVIGLPVAGALVVVLARWLLPGDGGHSPMKGLVLGPVPLSHAPGIALAATGTLAFGAVLGPEAPVIALGAVVGGVAARVVRTGEREQKVLATAGSCSAISALFGGPLVAGLLFVEAGLAMGTRLLPVLLPGLVAAAIGYVVFVGFGDWGGLDAPGLVVPDLPVYDGTKLADLLIGICVGVATAVAIVLVRRGAAAVERDGLPRLKLAGLLVAGGLAVGLLAQVSEWLGASSQDTLFSGQSAVPDIVAAGSTKVVLVLLVTKAIAYAISLGCGFRGGPIFPAVFLGVGFASLPIVWFDTSPTLAIAVGAAAGMAAQTKLVVAPVLFGALLVGTAGLDAVPAAVLACAAAWITMAALAPPDPDDR